LFVRFYSIRELKLPVLTGIGIAERGQDVARCIYPNVGAGKFNGIYEIWVMNESRVRVNHIDISELHMLAMPLFRYRQSG
jgi:hypothetical protein